MNASAFISNFLTSRMVVICLSVCLEYLKSLPREHQTYISLPTGCDHLKPGSCRRSLPSLQSSASSPSPTPILLQQVEGGGPRTISLLWSPPKRVAPGQPLRMLAHCAEPASLLLKLRTLWRFPGRRLGGPGKKWGLQQRLSHPSSWFVSRGKHYALRKRDVFPSLGGKTPLCH